MQIFIESLNNQQIHFSRVETFFANRVAKVWNSLPEKVVEAGTLNMFKNSLDRLWSKQELVCNYRSVVDIDNYVY